MLEHDLMYGVAPANPRFGPQSRKNRSSQAP
jgi:hypothetical protein